LLTTFLPAMQFYCGTGRVASWVVSYAFLLGRRLAWIQSICNCRDKYSESIEVDCEIISSFVYTCTREKTGSEKHVASTRLNSIFTSVTCSCFPVIYIDNNLRNMYDVWCRHLIIRSQICWFSDETRNICVTISYCTVQRHLQSHSNVNIKSTTSLFLFWFGFAQQPHHEQDHHKLQNNTADMEVKWNSRPLKGHVVDKHMNMDRENSNKQRNKTHCR